MFTKFKEIASTQVVAIEMVVLSDGQMEVVFTTDNKSIRVTGTPENIDKDLDVIIHQLSGKSLTKIVVVEDVTKQAIAPITFTEPLKDTAQDERMARRISLVEKNCGMVVIGKDLVHPEYDLKLPINGIENMNDEAFDIIVKTTLDMIAQRKFKASGEMFPMPKAPKIVTKGKGVGTLSARTMSPEEIEAVEDSFNQSAPIPTDAWEDRELDEEEFQDFLDIDDEIPFETEPDEFELMGPEEEEFLKKQEIAKEEISPLFPEPIEVPKPPVPVKAVAPKVADGPDVQAKDMLEQLKKNNGQPYLNRKGVLVGVTPPPPVAEAEPIVKETTLRQKWDALLLRAKENNIDASGFSFEDQDEESIATMNEYIDDNLKS